MEETLRSQLLALAATFQAATSVTPQTAGKRALSDNTFFRRIESGENFTIKTFDRVVQWFADNWPEDSKWPDDLPRPASVERQGAA